MKLRKTNAVFSLISTALLFSHAISLGVWMLSQGSMPKASSTIAILLTIFFIIHAIISIILMATSHKSNRGNKGKNYPKLNVATIVQRISGALMIIFTVIHILGVSGILHSPRAVFLIDTPLFFLLVLAHIAVSTSKAFITLGIGNARFVKRADIVIKVICAITLIVDVIGFYLYVC